MLFPMANPSTAKDFETFWQHYPVKVGKLKAQQVWQKTNPNLETVLTTLAWQKTSRQWQAGFVPHPSTYLNQGRWLDERPEDLSQSVRSGACQGCGASEPCVDVKVCNANWLAKQKSRPAPAEPV